MLIAILFTHRKAPARIREKVDELWKTEIAEENHGIKEKVLLVTCYRVEAYLRIQEDKRDKILERLVPGELSRYAEILTSPSSIFEHLTLVGSGADSPAVGEPEVQGQVKSAYLDAKEKGWTGKYLSKAFEKSLFVSKKIREEAEFQRGSLSMPRIVSFYAKDAIEKGKNGAVLLVGTGEMGIAISRYLSKEKISYTIGTKDKKRAEFLKKHANLKVIVYTPETLPLYITHFPVVIFTTQTKKPLLNPHNLEEGKNPEVIIDLGFPENVDSSVKNCKWVKFVQIDEFKKVIRERLKEKENLSSYVHFRTQREGEKFELWVEKEEGILKLFDFVDKKIEKISERYSDANNDKKILKPAFEQMKKFLLYPTLKALRSDKSVGEVVKKWVKK